MSINNKKELIQALELAFKLERIPNLNLLIVNLKLNLPSKDFIKAMDFISEMIWGTILNACNQQILEAINYILMEDPEKLENFIFNLITLNKDVSFAVENAINSSIVAINDLYQVKYV